MARVGSPSAPVSLEAALGGRDLEFGEIGRDAAFTDGRFRLGTRGWYMGEKVFVQTWGDKSDLVFRSVGPIDLKGRTLQVSGVDVQWTLTNTAQIASTSTDVTPLRNSNDLTGGMRFDVMNGTTKVGSIDVHRVRKIGPTNEILLWQRWTGPSGTYTLKHATLDKPRQFAEPYGAGSLYGQVWGLAAQSFVAAGADITLVATGGSPVTSSGQPPGTIKLEDIGTFYGGGRGNDVVSPNVPGRAYATDTSSQRWWIQYTGADVINNLLTGCTVIGIPPAYSAGGVYGGGGDGSTHTAAAGNSVDTIARDGGWVNGNRNEGDVDKFDAPRVGVQQKGGSIEWHPMQTPTDYGRGGEWQFYTTKFDSLGQSDLLRLRGDGTSYFPEDDVLVDHDVVAARTQGNGVKATRMGSVGPATEAGIAIGLGYGYSGTVALLSNEDVLFGVGTKFTSELPTLPATIWVRGRPLIVASVTSDQEATLASPYRGETTSGQNFYRAPSTVLYQDSRTITLAGTVSPDGTTRVVPGNGTKFLQLQVGATITVAGNTAKILSIASDTSLTTDVVLPAATNASFTVTKKGLRTESLTIGSGDSSKGQIYFPSSNPNVGLRWGGGNTFYAVNGNRLATDQQLHGIDGIATKDLGVITGKTSAQIDALFLTTPSVPMVCMASDGGVDVIIIRRNGKWRNPVTGFQYP